MSQSPTSAKPDANSADYFRNWDALGMMIVRGMSFSGREPNCVFLNTGGQRFADISAASGLNMPDDGRSLAAVDWDHDGDLDLWIANRTAPRVRFMRNDTGGENHFLALRLEGTACNRDAIGARVELHVSENDQRKFAQTLRAGEGFLSQSSKWLHFGLGPHESIEKLTVRWPGSDGAEEFTGLPADGRYLIRQGAGLAVPLDKTWRKLDLKPSTPAPPPGTNEARVVLTKRLTVPRLKYQDMSGGQQELHQATGGPVLVNLWASWCAPCRQELKELTAASDALRAAGLNVLALSGEKLTDNAEIDPAAARRFLDEICFPFSTGSASADLARELTMLHNRALYKERPLPLPTSFLIDAAGRLAVIYRGAVSIETLLEDVKLLDANQDRIEAAAFPFPGQFVHRSLPINAVTMAAAYREAGYLQDAKQKLADFLINLASRMDGNSSADQDRQRRTRAEVLGHLGRIEEELGNDQAAAAAFREMVELLPNEAAAHVTFAAAMTRLGNTDEVAGALARALKLGPDDADILKLVGEAHLQLRQTDQAIEHLQKALAQRPDSLDHRLSLAIALEWDGQIAEAVAQYEEILARHSQPPNSLNNLAWLLATHPDEKVRDGDRAVELAQLACQKTDHQVPALLGTLAAAYAEAGRFDEAVKTVAAAGNLARASGQAGLAEHLDRRLKLHREGKPFHKSPVEPR